MKSPFKFLDAYGIKDKDVFYGREKEVDALYSLLFKSPLILLYGLSGTGKTSIIQCGLANKFDGPDWLPFFVRREQDINGSLLKNLLNTFEGNETEEISEIISSLFEEYLRPIYLIFDQFEELFILGSLEEQTKFAKKLRRLLEKKLPCKIILVIREEYLGQLYPMEKEIPALFDHRLRIEPMNNVKVNEVLEKSFASFNITLESPSEVLRQTIIDNVSAGKSGIQLPFLQVYLDMLYREDFQRDYGDSMHEREKPPLKFTHQEVRDFGKIDNVLEKFLKEQTVFLQEKIKLNYPSVQENAVQAVLDAFVTEDGTKRPVTIKLQDGILIPDEFFKSLLPELSSYALSDCLFKLQESRLLRISDKSAELAHDSLAFLIDDQRTEEQRTVNEVKRRLASAFLEKEKTGVWLTERQMLSMEELFPKIKLDKQLENFLKENRERINNEKIEKENERKKKLDHAEKQAQIEKALREKAQRNERRARIRTMLALALLIGAIVFSISVSSKIMKARVELKIMEDQTQDAQRLIDNAQSELNKVKLLNQQLLNQNELLQSRNDLIDINIKKSLETVEQIVKISDKSMEIIEKIEPSKRSSLEASYYINHKMLMDIIKGTYDSLSLTYPVSLKFDNKIWIVIVASSTSLNDLKSGVSRLISIYGSNQVAIYKNGKYFALSVIGNGTFTSAYRLNVELRDKYNYSGAYFSDSTDWGINYLNRD